MPTLNTVVKAARIKNEDWEIIEGYMNRNGISFSKFVTECASNLSDSSISNDIVRDFEVILALYDTDFESFFRALYKKVESMEIDVDEVMK